jgi:putative oxidoreductase
MSFLTPYTEHTYALMRIVIGLLFLQHGSQKLFDIPVAGPDPLPAMLVVAGTIELAGGTLVMLGLFAGVAAFICSGTMAGAFFIGHFSMEAILPIANRGELAVVYCFVFLYIAAKGSGIWSIDALRTGKG